MEPLVKHCCIPIALVVYLSLALPAAAFDVWVDASYSGGEQDGSEEKPYTSIQTAINNAIPNLDDVRVKAGTYYESLQLRSGVDVIGDGYDVVIISGGNTARPVYAKAVVNVLLKGLTLKHGRADLGGGAYVENSTVAIEACLIAFNSASWGGGVYLVDADLTVTDSTISSNAAASAGAGISAAAGCTLAIQNTDIRLNECGGLGGGIYVSTDSTAQIDRCSITSNDALDGAGVYWQLSDGTLSGSLVYDNIAGRDGGGIFIDTAEVEIRRCYISGNYTAVGGGGAGLYFYQSANAGLYNCVIDHNAAYGHAGAVALDDSSPSIFNNTIVANSGYLSDGGIIAAGASAPAVVNCIIWDNGDDLDGVFAQYSQVQDGDAGKENSSADPMFVDEAAGYYMLKPGSPCIDTGHPDASFNDPDGSRNDRGAYGGPDALGVPSISGVTAELVETEIPVITATCSAAYSSKYSALKAVDGSASTEWKTPFRSAPEEEHLTLDLGEVQEVSGVRILPAGPFPQLFPEAFSILVSEDGAAWTTVLSETGYQPQAGVWYEAGFERCQARYVRLWTALTPFYQAGTYMMQVAEFVPVRQEVRLSFVSPGGNSYDIRHAAEEITDEARFAAAQPLGGLPVPSAPGTVEELTVSLGLLPAETEVFFSVRAVFDTWQTGLSNSPSVHTPAAAPAAVTDLAVIAATDASLTVQFTASGDDGTDGTATAYDLRWSTAEITAETWSAANPVAPLPAPSPAGTLETITIDGLPPGTTCWVALIVIDDLGNESGLSNVATGATDPAGPPGDANGDGCVNILDLVLVRNNINRDPGSDGHPGCDVNGDGSINILDLIFVRNHINEGCK